jgi:hypothetical protein
MAKLIFLRVSGGHGSEAARGLAMPAANVPRRNTGSPELESGEVMRAREPGSASGGRKAAKAVGGMDAPPANEEAPSLCQAM